MLYKIIDYESTKTSLQYTYIAVFKNHIHDLSQTELGLRIPK